ncbi:hypothetical protein [Acidithiobacillus sulfurivorans]|jgi:hypothetical protein|uniref:Uncharacterized protein n=1 Tax=Acidithiobacillus sulfurivorans TaxID=1958756 RepID=A0ABS6A5K1_9PROT|nr:hypothetical protein [Acidithiobacillus sulfurivorans]MBU2761670.1 hypothetical protein [Acidithiobacillus sulfurivorans]MDD2748874.1 hypothetical protein [Acidithiobacillus sp.]
MSNLSALSAISAANAAGRQVLPKKLGAGYLACPPLESAVHQQADVQKNKIVVTYRDGIELTYLFDASVQIAELMQLVSRAGSVRKVIL